MQKLKETLWATRLVPQDLNCLESFILSKIETDYSYQVKRHFFWALFDNIFCQMFELENQLISKTFIITGKQGVGKTTLVNFIIHPFLKDSIQEKEANQYHFIENDEVFICTDNSCFIDDTFNNIFLIKLITQKLDLSNSKYIDNIYREQFNRFYNQNLNLFI